MIESLKFLFSPCKDGFCHQICLKKQNDQDRLFELRASKRSDSNQSLFCKPIKKKCYLRPIFYVDLAVGAPYDGPDGRGAVYIFLGSIDGILKKPAQVLDFSNILC